MLIDILPTYFWMKPETYALMLAANDIDNIVYPTMRTPTEQVTNAWNRNLVLYLENTLK